MNWQPKMIEGPGGGEVQAVKHTPQGDMPMYFCPVCTSEIWGLRLAPHNCNGTPPAKPKTFAELPCIHRGLTFTRITVEACDCKIDVKCCGKKSFCTANPVEATVNNIVPAACRDCDQIEPPPSFGNASAAV